MSVAIVALSPGYKESWNGHVSSQYDPCSNESILVYLTIAESVIPMRILKSDSIASVKLRIQSSKGFFVKKHKIVFKGKELARNDSLIRDYGVSDGNVLHLMLLLSDLQSITVKTALGKEFKLQVERKRNVGYVKQRIANIEKGFFDLNGHELICDGEELDDQRVIDDLCRRGEAVIHLLVQKSAKVRAKPVEKDFEVSIVAVSNDFVFEPLILNPRVEILPTLKNLITATFDGLIKGFKPIRSSEGSGGVYFMQDSNGEKFVSVFKPVDEEPMAVNNPFNLPLSINGEGLKKGTRVGEGAFREFAAYLLDHNSFSGVPPTVMVRCSNVEFNYSNGEFNSSRVKIGSLQVFVHNIGSCEDMGPRDFSVEEVHKIAVLDIRLANADRHCGNILVRREGEEGRIVLIPIDHGYCLPENFEDCTFDWLYWPQSHAPFSPATLSYIKSLDADQDIELLKINGWDLPIECKRTLRISTMLLKKGAERNLTPFAIGSIMCRENLKKQSLIEHIVLEASESVLPGTSEETFLECVSLILDRRLAELYP